MQKIIYVTIKSSSDLNLHPNRCQWQGRTRVTTALGLSSRSLSVSRTLAIRRGPPLLLAEWLASTLKPSFSNESDAESISYRPNKRKNKTSRRKQRLDYSNNMTKSVKQVSATLVTANRRTCWISAKDSWICGRQNNTCASIKYPFFV